MDMPAALDQIIEELRARGERGDVVAAAWSRHFASDLKAFRLWCLAHIDETVKVAM